MGLHLRELTEQINEAGLLVNKLIADSPNIEEITNGVERYADSAICFDIGEGMEMSGFRCIPELVRLPYSVCWFEYSHVTDAGIARFGVLAIDEYSDPNKIIWIVFCRPAIQKEWSMLGWANIQGNTEDQIVWGLRPKTVQPYAEALLETLHIVGAFLSAMNCTNITKRENLIPEKLQKARAKRGKKPLFSYWTLELNLPKFSTDRSGAGGTHAAPRLHLCRGHMKKRKTGYFWWQPHVRGDKKSGMVQKDYAASYQQTEASNAKLTGSGTESG